PHRRPLHSFPTRRSSDLHVAELPSWIAMTLDKDELDFATNPYKPVDISTTQDLLTYFDDVYKDGKANLEKADETQFSKDWTLRRSEEHTSELQSRENLVC